MSALTIEYGPGGEPTYHDSEGNIWDGDGFLIAGPPLGPDYLPPYWAEGDPVAARRPHPDLLPYRVRNRWVRLSGLCLCSWRSDPDHSGETHHPEALRRCLPESTSRRTRRAG